MKSYLITVRDQENNKMVLRASIGTYEKLMTLNPEQISALIGIAIAERVANLQKSRGIVNKLTCNACDHTWRKRTTVPIFCPKCHSKEWNGFPGLP